MKKPLMLLQSLFLSALMAGTALAADKVDINSADAVTLERVLVGIGPSKAEAIVAHRTQHGAFRSADELVEVKGIGLSIVERNRELITVGAGSAVAPAAAAKPKAEAAPVAR